MSTSMNKQNFLDSIIIGCKDYRRDPVKARAIWENLSKKSKKKCYRPKAEHFKEALWILRDFIHIKNINLEYLDGEMMRHIDATFPVYKNGNYVGMVFLSNSLEQSIVIVKGHEHSRAFFGMKQDPTVKDFIKSAREIRDYLKTI